MSAPEQRTMPKLRPPVDETRKALESGARTIARLLARRTKLLQAVDNTDIELSTARKLLRDLIRDVATPANAGVQLTADDMPPEEP